MYTYTVEVSDGETSNTTQLIIIVTDINDKSPEFVKEFYSFELNENTPLSPIQYIGSVRATDDDSGTNAEVRENIYTCSKLNYSLYSTLHYTDTKIL